MMSEIEDQILEESHGKLKLKEELKMGYRVFNEYHKKENLIFISNKIDKISVRTEKGWSVLPGKYKYILRAPEVVLCDLSEIHVNPTTDPQEIYTFHKLLNGMDFEELKNDMLSESKFPNLEIIKLEGAGPGPEYRVAVSDERGLKLPSITLEMLKKSPEWEKEMIKTKDIIKKFRPDIYSKSVEQCNKIVQHFYSAICSKYKPVSKIELDKNVVGGFWHAIPKKDIYIFVPKAGLKYAYGFVEDNCDYENVMLWECHVGPDMEKELVMLDKDLNDKDVAVIDRSYSSNTLLHLKNEVKKLGGRPYSVALFPKSKAAIENSDSFLFIDKFHENAKYSFSGNGTWYEDLFIDVTNSKK